MTCPGSVLDLAPLAALERPDPPGLMRSEEGEADAFDLEGGPRAGQCDLAGPGAGPVAFADPEQLKWRDLVAPTTPLPTPWRAWRAVRYGTSWMADAG